MSPTQFFDILSLKDESPSGQHREERWSGMKEKTATIVVTTLNRNGEAPVEHLGLQAEFFDEELHLWKEEGANEVIRFADILRITGRYYTT